ncbi:MAG: lysozyme inhibitor LprI family protein [Hyphomonadaceae bacterium]
MRHLLMAAALLAAGASGARADEANPDNAQRVLECVSAAAGDAAMLNGCQGAAANPCMETDGGATTHGMVMCLSSEADAWARVMQASLLRLAEAQPETQSALEASQIAWESFRDAECSYRVARWGEGSGARVVLAGCLSQQTATRAMVLVLTEYERD